MNRSEVADVLDRAADALMIYGRCRTRLSDEEGRMCALGAIAFSEGVEIGDLHVDDAEAIAVCYNAAASRQLGRYLVAHGLRPAPEVSSDPDLYVNRVWSWNDSTDDDGEVIDQLRRCAKELREVGE